jgi:hypothetical protein
MIWFELIDIEICHTLLTSYGMAQLPSFYFSQPRMLNQPNQPTANALKI